MTGPHRSAAQPLAEVAPPEPAPRSPDRAWSEPDPVTGGRLRQVWGGVQAAFGGFGFAVRHGDVAAWVAGAVAWYLLIWVVVLWTAAAWDHDFAASVLWVRGPSWWESALWQVANVLVYLVFWVLALVLAFTIALPLMAPVFTMLSEVVERRFYGDAAHLPYNPGELLRELAFSGARSFVLAIINVAGAAMIWGVGLMLSLIFPPLGTIFSLLVGGSWAAMWFAFMGMNWILENNRSALSQQFSLAGRQLPLMLGFGAVAQLLAWLPPTVPLIVVGATLLCCRLNRHGHVALPLRDAWEARRAEADRQSP